MAPRRMETMEPLNTATNIAGWRDAAGSGRVDQLEETIRQLTAEITVLDDRITALTPNKGTETMTPHHHLHDELEPAMAIMRDQAARIAELEKANQELSAQNERGLGLYNQACNRIAELEVSENTENTDLVYALQQWVAGTTTIEPVRYALDPIIGTQATDELIGRHRGRTLWTNPTENIIIQSELPPQDPGGPWKKLQPKPKPKNQ